MRRAALVAVGLAALLAGCAEDPAPVPAPSSSQGPSSTSGTASPAPRPPVLDLLLGFALHGCHGLTIEVPRPLEDVQALLPPGFQATPGPTGGGQAGILAVDLMACANLTTAAVSVPEVTIGAVYTYVERPLERVPDAPDVPVHEYVFRVLAGTDLTSALWPAAGYDSYNGTPDVVTLVGQDPGRLSFAGVGQGYTLLGAGGTVAPPAARDQAFARYSLHRDGDGSVLLWTGTYGLTPAASGGGYAEVAADDPFAAYAPPERRILTGVARHIEDGTVTGQDLRRIFA